jgi:tripartite-type tricarboxylate transporter receptor subunit TctC
MQSFRRAVCTAFVMGIIAPAGVAAQGFPAKPVRILMPLPAGSETDVFARVLAKQLSDGWTQQVLVENRPGAGTTIATDMVAKSAPDGHTIMHAITPHGVNPTLYARLPYDTLRDLSCVTHIGNLYGLLAAHPSFPAKNVKELIAMAKRLPGQITYATGGSGTANHIATEALRAATGINIVHVPYQGTSLAVLDVLPGRVALLGTILPEAMPYIKAGKLRVLAITSPKRAPSLPDVPTVTESVPAYKVGAGFWLLITRAGTPPAVMSRLNADTLRALQSAEVRKRLASADIEYVGSTPEQCDAFVREQVAVWGALVKASGARVD